MAERKVKGADILLFIDPDGGTDYSLIICLTKQGLKRATEIIDAATKCGPDTQPGKQSVNLDFEGQQMIDPDAQRLSADDLHPVWAAKTTVGWKLGPADPITADVIYNGTGFIATLDEDYDVSNPATFSGSIGVYGSITQVIYP